MAPSIIPFTPPPPIELSEQNGKDLAEILRVYEVFGGFTAVGGYTTSQGEEVEPVAVAERCLSGGPRRPLERAWAVFY